MTRSADTDPARSSRTPYRRSRLVLGAVGIALLGLGAILFVDEIPLHRWSGVGGWLLGALVVHDGLIAGLIVLLSVLLRRSGWSAATKAIVNGALAVGGVMALVVVPAAVKRAIGTANPTILPLDYLGTLVWFELTLAAVALVAIATVRAVRARRAASQ